ncbi:MULTISPECIES: DUF2785 domain-containing protein [unclassified Fusibacter]|uniref:DUF2785 domain-containing protein n=1 Tax=unclassified Fusibacter TaxID=2624464 RepID=UPI0013E90589|nr:MULTISPECIES: DUF2785 domain-containing protein [unclassified Fusibacter]MCK8061596.1 DUF2785 domain-containing protein [Fusibacter sp. A2]NPE23779.1 DUF2785 domain-containing protein [Fusibacter sp. A1]
MLTKQELKIRLKAVKAKGFELTESETVSDYLEAMLAHIGDPDAELRDELIYECFYFWIVKKDYLPGDEVKALCGKLLSDDYAFYQIGTTGDDSVLRRSFSILAMSPVLSYCLNKGCLNDSEVVEIKEKLIDYLMREKDTRGFVEAKGWAHSIAHCADALNYIVNFDSMREEDYLDVLNAVRDKLLMVDTCFGANEDERLSFLVSFTIIPEKRVGTDKISEWLATFVKVNEIEDYQRKFMAKQNCNHFIRSIYFSLVHLNAGSELLQTLIETEKALNMYYRHFK